MQDKFKLSVVLPSVEIPLAVLNWVERVRAKSLGQMERDRGWRLAFFPLSIIYLLSIQTMFEDHLRLYVPCWHTEKTDNKVGVLQLVGKLCLLLKVSDPWVKGPSGSKLELETSSMLNGACWCLHSALEHRCYALFDVCSVQHKARFFMETSWWECGLWSQVTRL